MFSALVSELIVPAIPPYLVLKRTVEGIIGSNILSFLVLSLSKDGDVFFCSEVVKVRSSLCITILLVVVRSYSLLLCIHHARIEIANVVE